MKDKSPRSSWQSAADWYDKVVGQEGHYYHEHLILPGVLRLLELKKSSKPAVLDLCCGQGVLARQLPKYIPYVGVDAAKALIDTAKKRSENDQHHFLVADVTEPLPLEKRDFTHAVSILAVQNVERPQKLFHNARHHLVKGGAWLFVLNHPCFRIPRQSSWGIDAQQKLQYRRINRYLSPLQVPIQMHPGQQKGATTWSYHYALSDYSRWLAEEGFVIERIEEWVSDKESTGSAARMENFSRKEFPLFMTLLARAI